MRTSPDSMAGRLTLAGTLELGTPRRAGPEAALAAGDLLLQGFEA